MLVSPGKLGRMGGHMRAAVAVGLTWVTTTNVTTTPTSMTLNVAGVGWSESASSIESQAGNFTFDATPLITGNAMIGVNSDPLTDNSFTSIDYAMFAQSTGNIKIYESGTQIGVVGTYVPGVTKLTIKRVGTAVTYYIDDALVWTSVNASAAPLYIDSSLNTQNSGFDAISFIAQ